MSLINLLLFGYIRKREGLREGLFVLRYNFHKESNLARARYIFGGSGGISQTVAEKDPRYSRGAKTALHC